MLGLLISIHFLPFLIISYVYQTIRQWLHSIPTNLSPIEIRKGYKSFSNNQLKLLKRSNKVDDSFVSSLDPDSSQRQSKQFHIQDQNYDKPFLKTLFDYVRLGRMDLAIDACISSDQHWRAASLRGGILYFNPMIDDNNNNSTDSAPIGNPNRNFWKSIAHQFSQNPNVDLYERALYGALSGTLTSVLPVCNTWEDHLWAYVNALLESSIDLKLNSTCNYWFEDKSNIPSFNQSIPTNLNDIFDQISKTNDYLNSSSNDPYTIAQVNIILNRSNHLLTSFANQLNQSMNLINDDDFAELLCFFAHLVLFFRELGPVQGFEDIPQGPSEIILEAYVRVLEARGEDKELVGLYAGCLGEGAGDESYAHYLWSLDINTPKDVRQSALLQTSEHGLNLERVANRTVELTLLDTFLNQPQIPLNVPDITSFSNNTTLSYQDLSLVRSIEWLIFDKSTYNFALVQTNGLLRYFLSSGNIPSAWNLLTSLPSDLLSFQPHISSVINDNDDVEEIVDDQVVEYMGYKQLFEIFEIHNNLLNLWSQQPDINRVAKIDFKNWSDQIETLTHIMKEKTIELFQTEWLRLGEEVNDKRQEELENIRQIYIPELVHRLHIILYEAKSIKVDYIDQSLDLSNIVADERYRIYLEFVKRSSLLLDKGIANSNILANYLELVKQASLSKFYYQEQQQHNHKQADAFKRFIIY